MTEALTSLLDSTGSPDAAAREIAETPALREEARALLAGLQHVATAKAGAEGVKAVIGRRFATYPQPQRDEGEAAAWWADYFDVLADVPLAQLEAAMRAYVALPDSEFMPKPGKLRDLTYTTPCRSLQRYQRARRALDLAEEPKRLPGKHVDPADVRALLAEFEAKTLAGAKADGMPYIGGVADEGGITPQMRALIARRA